MLKIATVQEAVAAGRRRRFVAADGPFEGYTDFLFESAPDEGAGPQAFLVHQAPDCTLPAHFHMQHQVQVIVGGSGLLGRHPLVPGAVHYASPQSAYGPLVAGPQGLEYFTLRVKTDKGAWYLPASRPAMQAGLRKEQVTAAPEWASSADRSTTLVALRDDGLAAWAFRAEADETVQCAAPAGAAGRFHIVLQGSFEQDGRPLPAHACVFTSPTSEAPCFRSTAPGSTLIIVQFPQAALDCNPPPDLPLSATRQASTVMSGGHPEKPER
jgi:hypothetical protein